VEDRGGIILFESDTGLEPEVDPRLTYLITDMLQEAVNDGTGSGVRRGGFTGPAAGKTGTTQDGADAWFVGYTPRHVAAVWLGHDRPRRIVAGGSGGRLAAPLWGALMARIERDGDRSRRWQRPEGVSERPVDLETGLILGAGCRLGGGAVGTEMFLAEWLPDEACPQRSSFFSRLGNALRGLFGGRNDRDGEGSSRTSVEPLDGTEPVDVLLGVERVPLASP
jgi:penicillin-binding protein 1A